jgi:hypothetical protein
MRRALIVLTLGAWAALGSGCATGGAGTRTVSRRDHLALCPGCATCRLQPESVARATAPIDHLDRLESYYEPTADAFGWPALILTRKDRGLEVHYRTYGVPVPGTDRASNELPGWLPLERIEPEPDLASRWGWRERIPWRGEFPAPSLLRLR